MRQVHPVHTMIESPSYKLFRISDVKFKVRRRTTDISILAFVTNVVFRVILSIQFVCECTNKVGRLQVLTGISGDCSTEIPNGISDRVRFRPVSVNIPMGTSCDVFAVFRLDAFFGSHWPVAYCL